MADHIKDQNYESSLPALMGALNSRSTVIYEVGEKKF